MANQYFLWLYIHLHNLEYSTAVTVATIDNLIYIYNVFAIIFVKASSLHIFLTERKQNTHKNYTYYKVPSIQTCGQNNLSSIQGFHFSQSVPEMDLWTGMDDVVLGKDNRRIARLQFMLIIHSLPSLSSSFCLSVCYRQLSRW